MLSRKVITLLLSWTESLALNLRSKGLAMICWWSVMFGGWGKLSMAIPWASMRWSSLGSMLGVLVVGAVVVSWFRCWLWSWCWFVSSFIVFAMFGDVMIVWGSICSAAPRAKAVSIAVVLWPLRSICLAALKACSFVKALMMAWVAAVFVNGGVSLGSLVAQGLVCRAVSRPISWVSS